MREMPAGKIGSLDVRLAAKKNRYERRYVPVTPTSREIIGSDAKVAEESTVAEWHIDDWSAGEGDLRWRDRGRYNESSGAGPVSDGSGVTCNALYEQLKDTGGSVNMTDARILARAAGRFVTADDMGGTLFFWDDTNDEWDVGWSIGGAGSDDVLSIAAVNDTDIYVSDSGGSLREVKVGANAEHYSGWGPPIVSFHGQLYGLDDNDLYDIDTSATDTRTLVTDVGGSIDNTTGMIRRITTSDVGPVWLAPMNDGKTFIYEYNVADDTGYIVGELPSDVQAYDIWFHSGIYFAAFRYAAAESLSGDAWLYYQVGGQRGVAGPLRSTTGTTASKEVCIAGVVGDRLYMQYDAALWAYDLSSGGISMVARGVAQPTSALAYGSDIHIATGTTSFRIDLGSFDTGASAELTTGRHDFGYLGLNKILTVVRVACESALAASETVGLAYAVDGGSFTTASGTMVATEATKAWTISTSSTTVRGVEFELKLLPKANTSASSPKIVTVTAEAIGSESRLEWVLLLDVGDTNEQRGLDTLQGLRTLKTSHDVVSFTDPWQVAASEADETFDVTVEEVNLPDEKAGSEQVAAVRLRAVVTV